MTDVLGLKGDDYWGESPEPANDAIRALAAADFDGLKLGGPTRVPLDVRKTAPVIVYRGGSFRQVAEVSLARHGVLTIVDVDRNTCSVRPVVDEPEVEQQETALDLDSLPEGYSGIASTVDVLERGPSRPGRYLVTALMRDKTSNRLVMELVRGPTGFDDPEVGKLLRAERMKTPASPVSPPPGATLPAYGEVPGAPAMPAEAGIALTLDRVVVQRAGARAVLRGAFRLPVLPEEIVKAGGAPLGERFEGPQPTAVRRITLVVSGGDDPLTCTFRLDLPSWDPVDPAAAAPVVTGRFALDLLQLRGMPAKPQTYFVYAFSGEVMVGPVLLALVAEEALPKR